MIIVLSQEENFNAAQAGLLKADIINQSKELGKVILIENLIINILLKIHLCIKFFYSTSF